MKRHSAHGIVLATLLLCPLYVYCTDAQQAPLPTNDRNWWVSGSCLSVGNIALLKLGICSTDKVLITKLTTGDLEITPGKRVIVMLVHDSLAITNSPVPMKEAILSAGSNPAWGVFLEESIRVKGDAKWLRLGDVLRAREGGGFALYRCARCWTLRGEGDQKCNGCGAQYSLQD